MSPTRDHATSPAPFPTSAAAARPDVDELVAIALARGEDSPTLVQTYLSIRGRFPRRSFWLHGVLGLIGIGAVASMLLEIADVDPELSSEIVALALAWPYIAITGKRLHDLNCSAWWLLANLVPGVGSVAMLLVAGLLPGRPADNRFGPDPRAVRERERLQRPAFVSSVH
jgi:uncharacterized membrane protein YhaH (DUF805 family)